ncbi:metallophosphoesterase [SAR92 clade bacterium H231]|nr:metallophosphoesterase [SAR92 clade bacterium H231]
MKHVALGNAVLAVVLVVVGIYVNSGTKPRMNTQSLYVLTDSESHETLRVALLSDLHVKNSPDAIAELTELWSGVIEQTLDIILLGGDYINDGASNQDIASIGPAIANIFRASGGIPVVAVLGNHDHWSGAESWTEYLSEAGVTVLENETVVLEAIGTCIRGFGDAFTGHFKYVDFSTSCADRLQITLTHDPAGAFNPKVEGLVLAGHTHCGQISIPLLGPLYVPTQAPREAHCGLYKDKQRQIFVSSGIGTSVIPLRFNAKASWDLITIHH